VAADPRAGPGGRATAAGAGDAKQPQGGDDMPIPSSDPAGADCTGGEAAFEPEAIPSKAALTALLRRLARLEARVAALAVALADTPPGEHLPEACRRRACAYFQGYLAYGPPELTHDGYHAAERLAEAHIGACNWDWRRGGCPTCADWERRLRF
jgi:hypothetical protein